MSDDQRPVPLHDSALATTPIRDLGLQIEGTPLAPLVAIVRGELAAVLRRLRPRFYLSTEWGVPFETIAVGIPFYLARPELTRMHAEQIGHVEGLSDADILGYLRHELGHAVNYAYRLYATPEWIAAFGAITQPYLEEYRPEPFSRRFVRHLPGWYAQKHPDEDWAETFAIWLTPALDWRSEYADWPAALAKLEYCERTLRALAEVEPPVQDDELDEDVGELDYSIAELYARERPPVLDLPRALDGALRTLFADLAGQPSRPARPLLARLEADLVSNVYRWTGHFPERTRLLVKHLGARAEALALGYAERHEATAITAITTLVTALAMNHVAKGHYI